MDNTETRIFKNWWLLFLKGILLIVYGILAIVKIFPSISSLRIFIIVTLINGVLILLGSIFYRKNNLHWIYWLIEGAFDFLLGIAGIVLILMMKMIKIHVVNLFIVQIVALWALVHGIVHTLSANRLRNYMPKGKIAMFSGIGVIIFSVVLFIKPLISTVPDYIFIGSFCIFTGMALASISVILRRIYSE